MGRKKIVRTNARQQESEYSKIKIFPCPYLNLVHAILQRELDDLVLEIPYKLPVWQNSSRSRYKYLRQERCKAFSFFLNEQSQQFQDFLYWCDIGGFDYKEWQNKALLTISQHIIEDPLYYEYVVKNLVSKSALQKIEEVVSYLLKNVTIH